MSHVPPDTAVLTAYVCPRRCADAIAWYAEMLGAIEEGQRYLDPDGRIGHAQIRFGDSELGSSLMLSDSYPDHGAVAPEEGNTTATFALQLFVPDADRTVAAAEAAGAVVQRPVEEQFYGARMGVVLDPFGLRWMISTHLRDVSDVKIAAAADDFAQHGA
jgi:PhnB protein